MSLKVTLPEKPNLPFIVPDSAEAYVRDVHINWRSPDEQLQVKMERIKDEGSAEPQSIEEAIRTSALSKLKEGNVYLKKRKYLKDENPSEITVQNIVNKSITYLSLDKDKKLPLSTKTQEEFLELIKKYNIK